MVDVCQVGVSTVSPGKGFYRVDRTGVPKGVYAGLKKILGHRLRVDGYDLDNTDGEIVRRHLTDLDRLPKDLFRKTVEGGLNWVVIGPGSVAQLPGYGDLAKVPALGYSPDTTYLDISCAYSWDKRSILLGTAPEVPPHCVPHEFTHALADSMGYEDDFRVERAYRQMLPTLHRFYTNDGAYSQRGRREFLADSGARAILYGEVGLTGFPDFFVDFLLNVLLKGKTSRTR